MAEIRKYLERLSGNVIVRNIVLAVCAIIVFIFLVNVLLNIFTRHNKYKTVPDFSNMTVAEAQAAARKSSLRIEVNDSLYVPALEGGLVLTQMPDPGTHVKSGRRIFVTVNSYRQRMVRVPNVTGFSLRQAKNNIEVAGLEIGQLQYRSDLATNYVLETRYDGRLVTNVTNYEAEVGSGVTLVVGMRPDEVYTTVPKVVGFPAKEAKSRLWETGLNVERTEYEPDISVLNRSEARVWSQVPEQGTRVKLGTPVSIKLTLDETKVEQGSESSDKAAVRIIANQPKEEQVEFDPSQFEEAEELDVEIEW